MNITDSQTENIILDEEVIKLKRFKYRGIKYRLAPTFNLKLIDFGNAVFPEDFSMATINTRQFRAPEVILSKSQTLSPKSPRAVSLG